ncbi:LuxR family transcriptional regulator [Acidisoma sp. 7E03]
MVWLDPARLSRECLVAAVLSAQPSLAIQAFESLEACLAAGEQSPGLVIIYSHGETTVDITHLEAVRSAYPEARLVVLSDAITLPPTLVRDILSLGVSGFILTRRTGLQMMISALSLVHSGGTFVPRDFLFLDSAPSPAVSNRRGSETRLTQREQAVLDLIRYGRPNKLIADELGMSASTVKVHVRNIMQKMGVANRTQVALNAEQFLGTQQ